MKRLTTLLIAAVLLAAAAHALAADTSHEAAARSVVPSHAELLRTRTDDGLTEFQFRVSDDTTYEVDVDPVNGKVVHLDIDAKDQRGSASVVLTPAEAEARLLALYPDASIYLVHEERDDGRYEYQIHFGTDSFIGRAELNAETGALLDAELDYTSAATLQAQGPLDADGAKALALSMASGSKIIDFETDNEDGRKVYEGEIRTDNGVYEFVIDAETGRITEWQKDT